LDGHQWDVAIDFPGGTQKTSAGSNAYPATWNTMAQAFLELTGENVLLGYLAKS